MAANAEQTIEKTERKTIISRDAQPLLQYYNIKYTTVRRYLTITMLQRAFVLVRSRGKSAANGKCPYLRMRGTSRN